MSSAQGFTLPLHHDDWTERSERTGWGGARGWRNNHNVSLLGSGLEAGRANGDESGPAAYGPASARVADAARAGVQPAPRKEPRFAWSDERQSSYGTAELALATADMRRRAPVPSAEVLEAKSKRLELPGERYQEECNILIVPIGAHKRAGSSFVQEFGFLAAGLSAEQSNEIVLEVTPILQRGQVDPAVLRALKAGPYRNLPLEPASDGLKGLRLTRNANECKGWLARLIREAEEIFEEVVETLEHPFRHSSRLRLRLPPKGVQPLLLQIELDAALPLGSVHAFDITQTAAGGQRRRIRVGTVVVP